MSSSLGSLEDSLFAEDCGICTFLWILLDKSKDDGKYTDACFVVKYKGEEHTYFGHKFVFSMRSPYFQDKFFGREKCENCLIVEGVNPREFETMRNYFYDLLPTINTPEKACDIYKVAKEFEVVSLMNFCKEKLDEIKITPSNVFDMLQASNYLQLKCTEDRCRNFFQKNTREVIRQNTEDLHLLPPTLIKTCLSSKQLSLESLFDLFEWVFTWAKNMYLKSEQYHSARVPLEEILPYLPFASLKLKEFAEIYECFKDSSILTEHEVISIFMEYAIPGKQQMPSWYDKNCKIDLELRESG